jgi:hypothetical protein
LLSLTAFATAQSDDVSALYASAANVPTNITGIHMYAVPPNGFNPLTASDVELATYGFPPRPDQQADPDHYALWERAMKAARIRWNGELKGLPGSRRGVMPAASSPEPGSVESETAAPKQIATNNASGVILTNKLKAWNKKNSFNAVTTLITVPKAQLPFNTEACTASDYTEVSFAGIDGFVFNTGNGNGFTPMLQGGVYADVNCSYGTSYYAYFAWQDNLEGEFQVNPGDVVYAEVLATGGSNDSYVLLEDFTTQTYGSYTVSTPGIVGNSANWIVARLCCVNNQPYPLANTVNIFFDGGTAYTDAGSLSEKLYYPGSQASSTKILTMTDDGGDESIETVRQGSAGYEGQHSLFFSTFNCAFNNGCTP